MTTTGDAAVDTEIATNPITTCTEFFDQRSAVHAKIHLLQTLTHVFRCTVNITVPLETALFDGNCLWDRPDTPNHFCSLLFTKPSPLSPTGTKESMILHLKAERGGGWSDKDLEKVLHQAITIPERIDDMIHNLHNIASASALFFGKKISAHHRPQLLATRDFL